MRFYSSITIIIFFFFLIVLTPHVGSAEVSVRVKMATLAAENILAVLDGKPMVTPVPLG